jgi:hypothetical protein
LLTEHPIGVINIQCIQILNSLRSLGREHCRIGVSEQNLYDFSDLMVLSLRDCLITAHAHIIPAWIAVFKYVVHHMTQEKYNFIRCNGGMEFSSKELFSPFRSGAEVDTAVVSPSASPASTSNNKRKSAGTLEPIYETSQSIPLLAEVDIGTADYATGGSAHLTSCKT